MQHRRDIQGLRAFSVIAVLLHHAGYKLFEYGYLGVDIFLAISGYLLAKNVDKGILCGQFSLKIYYTKRALRILPTLYFVIIICIPLSVWLLSPDALENFGQSIVATVLFSNNLLLHLTSGYWDIASSYKPLLHTWSLGVEEQCYFILPLLLMVSTKKRWFIIITILMGSFYLYTKGSIQSENIYYLFQYRAWEVFAGALVALVPISSVKNRSELTRFLGFILVGISMFYRTSVNEIDQNWWRTVLCISGIIITLYKDHHGQHFGFFGVFDKLFRLQPVVYIGDISYSLYLVHQPIFAFWRVFSFNELNNVDRFLCVFTSIVAGVFLNKLIETPWRMVALGNFKKRILVLASVSATLLLFGGLMSLAHGLPGRWGNVWGSWKNYDPVKYNMSVFRMKQSNINNQKVRRIIVVGDSFARDFVNILIGGKIFDERQIFYSDDKIDYCSDSPIKFESELSRGSVVFLVSRSYDGLCFENIKRFIERKHARLYIVGPKDFGSNINPYIRVDLSDRVNVYSKSTDAVKDQISKIKQSVSADSFLDFMTVFGNAQRMLRVFDDSGEFITHDGLHLTRNGAVFFGCRAKAVILELVK